MLYFIKYTVHYKQVRARLVRRLIWVEELLCSNHNNLKWDFFLNHFYIKIYSNVFDM